MSNIAQLYGGYFLATFHFLLFCLDCRVWHQAKINYVFIFEYDTRHVLDWRQLAEVGRYNPMAGIGGADLS
jgi:xenotropic and polytropic retrovirus receptor 1